MYPSLKTHFFPVSIVNLINKPSAIQYVPLQFGRELMRIISEGKEAATGIVL